MTAMLPACRTGLFENVDVKVIPNHKTNKSTVRFIFKEKIWPEMESFKVAPSGTSYPYRLKGVVPPWQQLGLLQALNIWRSKC